MKNSAFVILILLGLTGYSQNDSTRQKPVKADATSAMEQIHRDEVGRKTGTNFEHWMYTEKKHALVGYYGIIGQGGFNHQNATYTLNHDLGGFYKGNFIDTKKYKLNLQVWAQQRSLLAGESTKNFSKELNMFSAVNGQDATDHEIALEFLYFENYFFDGLLDVTIGKIDPLFLTTFTTYGGWDKYTFMSKTMTSDPVPDMNAGVGGMFEINFNDNISVGGMITDNAAKGDFIDVANFFRNTQYAYNSFVRFAIPTAKNRYSYHLLDFYSIENENSTYSNSNGFTYVGNQGITDHLILVLKASAGNGEIAKYNSAYGAGVIYKSPFQRMGDQLGVSVQANEKSYNWEYGFDTYYKFHIQSWVTASANIQMYATNSGMVNFIPGARVFFTY